MRREIKTHGAKFTRQLLKPVPELEIEHPIFHGEITWTLPFEVTAEDTSGYIATTTLGAVYLLWAHPTRNSPIDWPLKDW